MSKTLYYVFDPLCGWCYGAGAAVAAVDKEAQIQIQLLPSGLFSGKGARPIDDSFAAYAWSNDQRIERLTGQRFTERYRNEVLAKHGQMFDSGPATIALTAVSITSADREFEALKAIQQARYIHGKDITQSSTLIEVLQSLGLQQAVARLARPDDELLSANQLRVASAQALLNQFGARGVPTFILETNGQRQLLHPGTAFSNPQAFVEQLAAA